MATETEMQATIKRLQQESMQAIQQLQMLQGGYFNVGNTFRAVVQDLLLALASEDAEDLKAAKANAKEIVKKWDEGVRMKQEADKARSSIIQPPELKVVVPNGDPS